jgi:hypothetical protein
VPTKAKAFDEVAEELVENLHRDKFESRELVRIIDEEQHPAVYRALKEKAARRDMIRPLPGGLLFSALFAAALTQPTDERSDRERDQHERGDHGRADEHIGDNDSSAVLDGHGVP